MAVTWGVAGQQAKALALEGGSVLERDWIDAHIVIAALDLTPTTRRSDTFSSPTSSGKRASRRVRAGSSACEGTTAPARFSKKRDLNRRPGPPVHDDLDER
jgi:putative transposase